MSKFPKPNDPHSLNVPGEYYVEDGCCTACGVPQSLAGDFFGEKYTDGSSQYHCYIKKQPQSGKDLDRLIVAMQYQEFDCIRYRGKDQYILDKLIASDLKSCCDEFCG